MNRLSELYSLKRMWTEEEYDEVQCLILEEDERQFRAEIQGIKFYYLFLALLGLILLFGIRS